MSDTCYVGRDRVLDDTELVTIWKVIDYLNRRPPAPTFVHFGRRAKLLILTGLRQVEVEWLCRAGMDSEKRMVRLPPRRSGHKQVVVSSDITWRILTEQQKGAQKRPFRQWDSNKTRLDTQLGESFKPWVVHDIRRTVATKMNEVLGVPPHIVEEVLGHRHGRAEDEVCTAMLRWSDHVQSLVEGNRAQGCFAETRVPEPQTQMRRKK
jgi:integrase